MGTEQRSGGGASRETLEARCTQPNAAPLEMWVILKPLWGCSRTQSRLFGAEIPLQLKSPPALFPASAHDSAGTGWNSEGKEKKGLPFLKGMKMASRDRSSAVSL